MYLRRLIRIELGQVVRGLYDVDVPEPEITFPKDPAHGDYATNFPLKACKILGKPPMDVARDLADALKSHKKFSSVAVAPPGFVNLFLANDFLLDLLETLSGPAELFSHYRVDPKQVNVEFVSANPTGPLTVGHGRNACLGDSIARLLRAVGHQVTAEYYFNNAGRQMKILGESLRARYLETLGQTVEFPEEGYVGEYISEIARDVLAREGNGHAADELVFFQQQAERAMFAMIRKSLDRLGIAFDIFFNEDELYRRGSVASTLDDLKSRKLAYESEGAVWFRGQDQGLSKDPVLVKKSGEPTYRLPDVAYHIDKLNRKFDLIVDVLGADHIDEHREVITILKSLGLDPKPIRGIIYQFVTLVRDGKPVKMSTRRAEYVTLDELLDDVGPDVARFFFLSRKADTHLEFDLELAKKESQENPVYYIQYAHARLNGIFRTAAEQGFNETDIRGASFDLSHPAAQTLAKKILSLGDVLESCVHDLEVTGLLWYLRELAETFHIFYSQVRVVDSQDRNGTLARLKLCRAVGTLIKSSLNMIGIQAPERM